MKQVIYIFIGRYSTSRIANGYPAREGEIPCQVAIQLVDQINNQIHAYISSGCLISNIWILTAAHIFFIEDTWTIHDHFDIFAGSVHLHQMPNDRLQQRTISRDEHLRDGPFLFWNTNFTRQTSERIPGNGNIYQYVTEI